MKKREPPKFHKQLYVIAGNHDQAKTYARENTLKPDRWRYVSSAETLKPALTGSEYVTVGTYYLRKDWRHLIEILDRRQLKKRAAHELLPYKDERGE